MAVELSSDVERAIERLIATSGYASADEVIRVALAALEADRDALWQRVEREDAEADDDLRAGRYRPVSDEFVEQLRSIVTRPAH
ncbi:MAG: type II toxin-antitoxin system ParD family antitoxin [Dehalococcoidia bacterium]